MGEVIDADAENLRIAFLMKAGIISTPGRESLTRSTLSPSSVMRFLGSCDSSP
jgi:hypothetical protein